MSKTVLILFAACVGLSLLSLHLVNQMRAGQATIAELQAQVAKLETRAQTPAPAALPDPLPIQPEPVAPSAAAPAKETVMGMSVKAPAAAAPTALLANNVGQSRDERTRMFREARERQRLLMQDPEYREAMRLQQRSNMNRQYPDIAREMGLSAEQTEQLFDVLSEQMMRAAEQTEPWWDTEGMDPAVIEQRREQMQQQWQETQRKNEAELAAQLGSDKAQAFKEYQSTLGVRHQAEQLRATLANKGMPLSDDANRAVVKALADAQKIEMQEYTKMSRANVTSSGKAGLVGLAGQTPEMYERGLEITKRRQQRVQEALAPYLSYEQREALKKEQEYEIKMQEAQMRMMRAQSKIDTGNNTNNGGWVSNSVQAVIVPAQ